MNRRFDSSIALHGTFLIDAEGFVRWNDLGAAPLIGVFAMSEFKRLLSKPVTPSSRSVATAQAD